MQRNRSLRTRSTAPLNLAAVLTLLVALTACSSDSGNVTGPSPEPEPEPGPTTARLQLDFDHVEVIGDCDGGLDGDGEFSFRVTTSVSSGGGGTVFNGSRDMGDGDRTGAIGRRTYSVPFSDGQQITVRFRATETDRNVFGSTFPDDRMAGIEQSAEHRFNNGRWSGTGPRSITLGSGSCSVRLRYSANAL